jgi:hypothetical protein
VNLVAALLPVVAFLAVLVLMDSFKLVSLRMVCLAIAAGASAALVCLGIDSWILDRSGLPLPVVSRYVAPVLEETAKAAFVLALARRTRVGFLVDAAIIGFAVGTGFALVENVDYLRELNDNRLVLWAVRGVGTAMLHGATTAIFAILLKRESDRSPERGLAAALPGWAAAIVIQQDQEMDAEYAVALRRVLTHAMEDPRRLQAAIEAAFIMRSLERIGDHAKNIARHIGFVNGELDPAATGVLPASLALQNPMSGRGGS